MSWCSGPRGVTGWAGSIEMMSCWFNLIENQGRFRSDCTQIVRTLWFSRGGQHLDADDVAVVAFDDWVEFTRWMQPCEGNSAGWDNLGYTWKSADGLAALYVPIHAIVCAELVSVDVGVTSAAGATLAVYFGFTTADYAASIVTGRVDFGDVMIEVPAGETRVTNVPLLDPEEPHDPFPFVFDGSRTLWLRIKAQDAHILFTGAKLNYRRKRVAV